jgi:hypothetical protein
MYIRPAATLPQTPLRYCRRRRAGFDDHRLAPLLSEFLTDETSGDISWSACGKADHDTDRPGGILLCMQRRRWRSQQ